jgi:hypothetical protein
MNTTLMTAVVLALLGAGAAGCAGASITGPDDPPTAGPTAPTAPPPPPAAPAPAPAPAPRPTPSRSPLAFQGTARFRTSGGSVAITIDAIANTSSTYTSGSLRVDLWASAAPYGSGDISGYRTASIRTRDISGLSDQLRPNGSFTNISVNLAFAAPPAGYSHYTLVLAEFDNSCDSADRYCIAAALAMR